MSLIVYGHPFSSYTQKVLIALFEAGTAFELREVGDGFPEETQDWLSRWPIGKFPVLAEGARTVAESSIIIEYLDQAHPGSARLVPADPQSALEARFMDRVFDSHVMNVVQLAVDSVLGFLPVSEEDGRRIAGERLARSYAWLDQHLAGRTWAAGEAFSLADCDAAPALFYADWGFPVPDTHAALKAYLLRVLARPSVARAVDGGRPYREWFPLKGERPVDER